MSQRVQIVLPNPVAAQLHELAASADEAPATLAARMVRDHVALAAESGQAAIRRARTRGRGKRKREKRAPWLEPYSGDPAWRAEMWGAIVALHGRYPRALVALKDEWWTDEAHTEILGALAVWRTEIDDSGVDPREELAFHGRLADYAHELRQEGGGVTKAWKPGAPPAAWGGT
jgi:hypothetical protein